MNRTLAERQAARRRYRQQAIARAELMGLTLRCQEAADDLDGPEHQFCRGEERGNAGCLCRCHDPKAPTGEDVRPLDQSPTAP